MNADELLKNYGPREAMEYDVVVVGAGPSGLACAIQIKQRAQAKGADISVAVLEKGSEVGAHILSGAVMDIKALNELLPDWQTQGAPLRQAVTEDTFYWLTEKKSWHCPNWLLPSCLHNEGNYVISLGELTRWLGIQAENLGVEIYPGFAAAEVLFDDKGAVVGVATGHLGLGKDHEPGANFQLGMELRAKYTVFAEGARGHLGKQLISRFELAQGKAPQSFGIGIKELWEVDKSMSRPGLVLHSVGFPHSADTYGGGFLYHLDSNKIALGLITGLDYRNPWLNPFEEFQRWKTHPSIRAHLQANGISAKRIAYGARAINASGLLSLPKLIFPGGVLVGCDAGFLNASRIKGSHAAIKSGMLAAEAIVDALGAGRQADELVQYPQSFADSWLYKELYLDRNFKTWFKYGRNIGIMMTGIEQWLLRGKFTWTLQRKQADHETLQPADQCTPITYPKPDGVISFDRLSSVYLSSTNHEENQPAHLTLKDSQLPVTYNLKHFAGPESRYCPAGVYEFVKTETGEEHLQINAQNCVHCKTCDIKDPLQNIVWVTPEGGGGPNYAQM